MSERESNKEIDMSKFYSKVKALPERSRKSNGVYLQIVRDIAKMSKGFYLIKLDAIKKGLKIKSAYPSFERALKILAKEKGVDFTNTQERQVTREGKEVTYTSYPYYDKFKNTTMRIRVANKQLHIEKLIDDPL